MRGDGSGDGSRQRAAALALVACGGSDDDDMGYVATALVTDVAGMQNPYGDSSTHVDPNLVNAWGIAFNPQGFVWVANAGTSTSTLYDGNGVPQSLVVAIPAGAAGDGRADGHRLQCLAGLPGDAERGERRERLHLRRRRRHDLRLVADRQPQQRGPRGRSLGRRRDLQGPGARHPGRRRLSVRDRLPQRRRRCLRRQLRPGDERRARSPTRTCPPATRPSASRRSATCSTSATRMQDAAAEDDVTGAGLGVVNVFDTAGVLVRRLISPGGRLNAPWGMAAAPANFGPFSNALLVAQFRRRPDQCLRSGDRQPPRHAVALERLGDHDRRPLGHRLRQRHQRAADQHPVLHRRTGRREPRRLRPHRLPLDARQDDGLSRSGERARAAPAAASRARPSARPGRRRCAGARVAASRPASSPRRRPTPAGRRR